MFTGVGGIAIGVAVGVLIAAVRRRVDDPLTDITISLLTAYAAYLPAEEVGASGVIAAVTVGVWLGWQSSELTDHATRLQLFAIWEVLQFLLNAFLFVLIGLQLPGVIDNLERPLRGRAGRLRRADLRHGDRGADRVGVRLHLPPPPRARAPGGRGRAPAGQRDDPGGLVEHARLGVPGRRAGHPADHRRRRARSPSAT